tara:strand:- start:22 stop:270 length:249 start_codon:yes stop_codon:yes gene_type:complete
MHAVLYQVKSQVAADFQKFPGNHLPAVCVFCGGDAAQVSDLVFGQSVAVSNSDLISPSILFYQALRLQVWTWNCQWLRFSVV